MPKVTRDFILAYKFKDFYQSDEQWKKDFSLFKTVLAAFREVNGQILREVKNMFWVVDWDDRCVVAGSFATREDAQEWINLERLRYGKTRFPGTLMIESD